MNSAEEEMDEKVFLFKKDVDICMFKDLKSDKIFHLTTVNDEGVSTVMDTFEEYIPSVQCQLFTFGYAENEDDTEEERSYISLRFTVYVWEVPLRVRWSCVVSIINVNGDPKFLQSMGVVQDLYWKASSQKEALYLPTPYIHCSRFVKRSLLLDDEEENLPGGTLTLRLEMEVGCKVEKSKILNWALSEGHFLNLKDELYGSSIRLNLSSSLFRSLCEESEYFRAMRHTPSQEEWLYIHDNLNAAADMLYFIESKTLDHVLDMASLLNLYVIADKYLVNNLIVQSRNFIVNSLKANNVAVALLLAYRYFDNELRDSCLKYIDSLSFEEQLVAKNDLISLKQGHIIAKTFR